MPNQVWPFIPQRGIKERTVFNTDVISCKSMEQRISLLYKPRTELEFNFQLLPQQIESATVLARKSAQTEFYIPFWQDISSAGNVVMGQTSLTGINTFRDRYKNGGHVFIMGDDNSYEVVEIVTAGATVALVAPGFLKGYSNAVICPAHLARFKSPFDFKKYPGDYYTSVCEFQLTSDLGVPEIDFDDTHKGLFVLSNQLISGSGGLEEFHIREFTEFDNVAGPLYYSETFTYASSGFSTEFSITDPFSMYVIRLFVQYTKGKAGEFYFPRWTKDFVIDNSIASGNAFLIVKENTTLLDSYIGEVCIVKKDFTQVYVTATSWTYFAPGRYKMNLSGAVGSTINMNDVLLICRMPKMRFDTDIVEFDYVSSSDVRVKLPMKEVP